MTNIKALIRNLFSEKPEMETTKFIEILEIIYAIILACGLATILEKFENDLLRNFGNSWKEIIIIILVLTRFFFAPSKNVKILVDKLKKGKVSIMLWDVPLLIAHSFIFYFMCYVINNEDVKIFYLGFLCLLIVNFIWLVTICARLRKEKVLNIKIWIVNNLFFSILYALSLLFDFGTPIIWFFFALFNSWIDIILTHMYYIYEK